VVHDREHPVDVEAEENIPVRPFAAGFGKVCLFILPVRISEEDLEDVTAGFDIDAERK